MELVYSFCEFIDIEHALKHADPCVLTKSREMGRDNTEEIGTFSIEICLLFLKNIGAIYKFGKSQDCMWFIMLMLVSSASDVLL